MNTHYYECGAAISPYGKTLFIYVGEDTGKASIRQESISELDRIHELLQANPNLKIQINGHTDNVGDADYNQKLYEQHARAVASYLLQHGLLRLR